MAKIFIEDKKRPIIHIVINNWSHEAEEPHLMNILCEIKHWSPFSCGECAEIQYGDEVYYIERKK